MDYAIARQVLAAIEERNPVDLEMLHGLIQLLEGAEARKAALEAVADAARAWRQGYRNGPMYLWTDSEKALSAALDALDG